MRVTPVHFAGERCSKMNKKLIGLKMLFPRASVTCQLCSSPLDVSRHVNPNASPSQHYQVRESAKVGEGFDLQMENPLIVYPLGPRFAVFHLFLL
jgi:hypothetical protein